MRARSLAAASRYLAGAGLYGTVGQGARHLRDYGSETGNAIELALCHVEGEVFVGPTTGGKDAFIPWPFGSDPSSP